MALRGRALVCSALGVDAPVPAAMVGSMATVALPFARSSAYVDDGVTDDPLHAALEAQGIQVMVAPWPMRPEGGPWRRVIRISAAPYVVPEDLERLARVLPAALAVLGD